MDVLACAGRAASAPAAVDAGQVQAGDIHSLLVTAPPRAVAPAVLVAGAQHAGMKKKSSM